MENLYRTGRFSNRRERAVPLFLPVERRQGVALPAETGQLQPSRLHRPGQSDEREKQFSARDDFPNLLVG